MKPLREALRQSDTSRGYLKDITSEQWTHSDVLPDGSPSLVTFRRRNDNEGQPRPYISMEHSVSGKGLSQQSLASPKSIIHSFGHAAQALDDFTKAKLVKGEDIVVRWDQFGSSPETPMIRRLMLRHMDTYGGSLFTVMDTGGKTFLQPYDAPIPPKARVWGYQYNLKGTKG